jgi:hypothetical protein
MKVKKRWGLLFPPLFLLLGLLIGTPQEGQAACWTGDGKECGCNNMGGQPGCGGGVHRGGHSYCGGFSGDCDGYWWGCVYYDGCGNPEA